MIYEGFKIGKYTASVPVIQGGMGVGVSLSGLAGAVAREGGVGVISTAQIGYREDDWEKHPIEANLRAIGKEISLARQIANGGVIGVNIMVATKFYERYVKEAVEHKIDLIISGAGLPMDLPSLTQGSDTAIAPIVSSKKATELICKMWKRKYNRLPDLIVIEGPKAGGHLGFHIEQLLDEESLSFDDEVCAIVTYVKEFGESQGIKIPVVLGGGVYDREDMIRCMELGVDGVQVATRFVTCEECDVAPEFKQAYINAKEEDINILKSPVGMPGRGIFNPNVELENKPKQCHLCIKNCNPAEIPYCITTALVKAAKGDVVNGMVFCGSNAYKAERIETVKEVMESFCAK